MVQPFRYLLELFYPSLCAGCGTYIGLRRQVLCVACEQNLPRTEHAVNANNKVSALFHTNKLVQRAGAFCYYNEGSSIVPLIHSLKYRHKPYYGVYLGRIAAQEFIEQSADYFADIDIVVPVPLHKKRETERGYNQSEMIARGIADVLRLPMDTTHLYRRRNNPTQTAMTAEERAQNTKYLFALRNRSDWKNKHILLVDDVVTTGATLRACLSAMRGVQGLQVSILVLGARAE